MPLEMLHFCVIDLAREYGDKQGLEIFCGASCRVLCSAVKRQTLFFSGQNYVLNHGQLCSGVVLLL